MDFKPAPDLMSFREIARHIEGQLAVERRVHREVAQRAEEHVVAVRRRTRGDLGQAYLDGATHAYGGTESQREAADAFRGRVSGADVLVHPQDDRERDILDGDGTADFAGGFAAAAAMLGNAPELYHLDTSQPGAPRARRLAEEVARIVRGRLSNPRWIEGMLRHGHRGVAEIAQGVDALFAFAATADVVPGSLFDATHAALGYRDLGSGRVWAADWDWQDNEDYPGKPYTESVLGYLMTHRAFVP